MQNTSSLKLMNLFLTNYLKCVMYNNNFILIQDRIFLTILKILYLQLIIYQSKFQDLNYILYLQSSFVINNKKKEHEQIYLLLVIFLLLFETDLNYQFKNFQINIHNNLLSNQIQLIYNLNQNKLSLIQYQKNQLHEEIFHLNKQHIQIRNIGPQIQVQQFFNVPNVQFLYDNDDDDDEDDYENQYYQNQDPENEERRQPQPMSSSEIKQIPTSKYKPNQKNLNCVVCMLDFKKSENVKILDCLHQFHAKCIDQWLKQKGECPICRHQLN
ncbi:unnamed protein product [Paramecium sonneborni]|uniref:RING-type domain-containing protein n=1 Tax=Paramecium sonneborni TaxID=65129 RepID=A0A8S1LJJ0_9CILI|nr:unnamed protein product [Paramecium sonneborni]